MPAEARLREELVKWGRRILEKNLAVGPGGNISARLDDVMLISPSGVAFDEVMPDDYVKVSLETGQVLSGGKPSSEILMHWYCYLERPDITAVVHTHPPVTIGIIGGGGKLEPMFPDFVVYLERLALLDYITPCTPELAGAVRQEIKAADGVLLVGHGALTVGANLREAYYRSEIIEESAKILSTARLFGNPRILSSTECRAIKELDSEKYRIQLMKNRPGS